MKIYETKDFILSQTYGGKDKGISLLLEFKSENVTLSVPETLRLIDVLYKWVNST